MLLDETLQRQLWNLLFLQRPAQAPDERGILRDIIKKVQQNQAKA